MNIKHFNDIGIEYPGIWLLNNRVVKFNMEK